MSSSDATEVVDLADLRDLMSTTLNLPLDEINASFPLPPSTALTECQDVFSVQHIVDDVYQRNSDKFESITFVNDSQLADEQLVDRGHCKFNFTKIV